MKLSKKETKKLFEVMYSLNGLRDYIDSICEDSPNKTTIGYRLGKIDDMLAGDYYKMSKILEK